MGFHSPHTGVSQKVSIIALLRLTRCVAGLRSKLPVAASCPLVYGCTSLSARSAKALSSLPRMPQTNKARNSPASDSQGSAQVGASAEDPESVTREVSLAAEDAGGEGGGGGGEDNVGDSEIIKSPSDPKQYR